MRASNKKNTPHPKLLRSYLIPSKRQRARKTLPVSAGMRTDTGSVDCVVQDRVLGLLAMRQRSAANVEPGAASAGQELTVQDAARLAWQAALCLFNHFV